MRLESLFPANWRWCRRGNQELLCLRWRFKIRVVVKGGLSLQNNTQYLNDQNYLMNQLHKSVLEIDFNAGLVCYTFLSCYQGHRKWNSLVKEVIHTTNPSHTIFYQKCLCDYCNLISTGLYLWIDLPPSQGGNWRSKNIFRVYCRVLTNHRLIQSMNHILPSGRTKIKIWSSDEWVDDIAVKEAWIQTNASQIPIDHYYQRSFEVTHLQYLLERSSVGISILFPIVHKI